MILYFTVTLELHIVKQTAAVKPSICLRIHCTKMHKNTSAVFLLYLSHLPETLIQSDVQKSLSLNTLPLVH